MRRGKPKESPLGRTMDALQMELAPQLPSSSLISPQVLVTT